MPKTSDFPRTAARVWTTALAATAPPLWLFSRLTPYHFLFSAPADLGYFGTVVNVCTFTGYLLATGILPTLYFSFLAVSAKSLFTNLFATALSIFFGVNFFTRGILLQGHPDFTGRAIGAVILVGAIVKWIPALQRLMRSHPLVSLLVGYSVGIGVVIVISFGWNQDVWMPVREHGQLLAYVPIKSDPYTFYQGKALFEFAFWDWAAALAGGIVYVAAARYWKSLLDPSTEIDEAVPPEANKS
ncbi:MAG TPA: hypothetical protein VE957_02155 [Terriglobales bacterium]|nr:hypothetical protein [Terriglobales bacterium]HYW36889.1 hypothetical protein [Terriglobales bacterium]